MANVKISNAPPFGLPTGAALTGSELIPMDQTVGGIVTTIKATASQIAALGSGITSILGTANEIAVSIVGTVATISFSPNLIIPAPSSGVTLTVNANVATAQAINVVGAATQHVAFVLTDGQTGNRVWALINGFSAPGVLSLFDATAGVDRLQLPITGGLIVPGGDLIVAQSVQVQGTGTTGFSGAGVELFSNGTLGVIQAFNRTSGAFIPVAMSGSTVTLNYGASASPGLVLSSAGNVTIAAPTSSNALTVNSVGIASALSLNSAATTLPGYAAFSQAGTNKGFLGVDGGQILAAGSANGDIVLRCDSGGGIRLSANAGATTHLFIANTGNVTIAAPSSGNALTVTAAAGAIGGLFNQNGASGTSATFNSTGAVTTPGGGNIAFDTNGNMFFQTAAANTALTIGSFASGTSLALITAGSTRISVNPTGNITIAAPSSGAALTVNSLVNTNAVTGSDGTTTWAIQTDSTPRAYIGTLNAVQFAITTNNATRWLIDGSNGGMFGAGATGGSQGSGTLNATGLFVNGVAVGTGGATTGTFTGTFTGLVGGPTVTCSWTKVGNSVTLFIPSAGAVTSNLTTFTLTGLPAAIQPTTKKYACSPANAVNSGSVVNQVSVSVSTSIVTFLNNGSTTGWAATGTKAWGDTVNGATITYDVT